jgi:hypothetical protein
MKKQIVRVSLVQNAKLMAALYLVLGVPMMLLTVLPLLTQGAPVSWWLLILMPIGYCAFGFVFTLIGAWVYNLVAARVGGFEFTTVETGKD